MKSNKLGHIRTARKQAAFLKETGKPKEGTRLFAGKKIVQYPTTKDRIVGNIRWLFSLIGIGQKSYKRSVKNYRNDAATIIADIFELGEDGAKLIKESKKFKSITNYSVSISEQNLRTIYDDIGDSNSSKKFLNELDTSSSSLEECHNHLELHNTRQAKGFYETRHKQDRNFKALAFNVAYAKARVQQAQNPSKNPLVNLNRLLHDPEMPEWNNFTSMNTSDISDDDWQKLHEKLENTLNQLYPNSSDQDLITNALSFFNKTMRTNDASTETGKQVIRHRVANVLEVIVAQATDPQLSGLEQERALKKARDLVQIIADGGSACADRAAVGLDKAENYMKIHAGTKAEGSSFLVNVLINNFKLNAIMAKLVDPTYAENLETYLYFVEELNSPLGLGQATSKMKYHAAAQKQDWDLALAKLFTVLSSEEDLVGYIASQEVFQEVHKTQYNQIQKEYATRINDLWDNDDLEMDEIEKQEGVMLREREQVLSNFYQDKAREALIEKRFLSPEATY